MFRNLLSNLQKSSQNDEIISQRRFPRRENDPCICLINGQPYPVENWSLGGLLVHADGRLFETSSKIEVELKFRLTKGILDIRHTAKVVRKSRNKVALEFTPLTQTVQDKFQTVIESKARA